MTKAARIDPSSVIEDGAKLGQGVVVGPFCHIGPQVELGEGVELKSHVVVAGRTSIGARARVFPFASLGHEPQDLKYRGEENSLTIGADCLIREGVTMNPGTAGGRSATIVGDRCAFLANAHVGHDCIVGSDCVFSNNVMLAGHVTIGDFVICGGGSAIIQFARIGSHAFVGGLSGITADLIPFGMAFGSRGNLMGLNLVGLKRRNFSRDAIHELRRAYRALFAPEGTLKERMTDVAEEFSANEQVKEILDFINAGGDRQLCTPESGKDLT
jgi:UDP-N-acetylglucosamine acyltransferase